MPDPTPHPPGPPATTAEGAPGRRAAGVRERARAELTREIVAAARRQLGEVGAAALSLRAVAREIGMVSSAVYRYVASRDELLTLLITQAYDALGAAAEEAEAAVPREDLLARWLATCTAVRSWALAHPHEHALIFGSPVPGYAAPQTTIVPAARVPRLLIGLLVEGVRRGRIDPAALPALGTEVVAALGPVRGDVPLEVPDELLARGILAWTLLVGAVSFELFGHTHNVVDDDAHLREAFFTDQVRRAADLVGLTGT
ncbi:MAG: TetR/AcrR family transcriptional regulator [Kineosporiaceae bacterium]|nr:TetR/AcrR family transcriptional regulator [Kineosporiaceae bacterium]